MASCKEEPCEGIRCQNGNCIEGQCQCELGFEGEHCESIARTKFIGEQWQNSRICQSGSNVLSTSIKESTLNNRDVIIEGLHLGNDIIAATTHLDSILIPIQVYGFDYLEGVGLLNDSLLTIEYSIIETGGSRENCISILSRK